MRFWPDKGDSSTVAYSRASRRHLKSPECGVDGRTGQPLGKRGTVTTHVSAQEQMVERASRLFEFLTRVQRLTQRLVRHLDTYTDRGGSVRWLHQVSHHDAVTVASRGKTPTRGAPLITVDRVPRQDPRAPSVELVPWITGRTDDPSAPPELKDRATVPPHPTDPPDAPATVLRLEGHPRMADAFDEWFDDWTG